MVHGSGPRWMALGRTVCRRAVLGADRGGDGRRQAARQIGREEAVADVGLRDRFGDAELTNAADATDDSGAAAVRTSIVVNGYAPICTAQHLARTAQARTAQGRRHRPDGTGPDAQARTCGAVPLRSCGCANLDLAGSLSWVVPGKR